MLSVLSDPSLVIQARKKGVTTYRDVRVLFFSQNRVFAMESTVSLDIYLLTLTDDEAAKFDRVIVERAFKDITVDQVGDYWHLRTTFGTVSVDDEPKIRGISVRSPPSYEHFPEFWNAMFEVLLQTHTVLTWPAGGPKPIAVLRTRI